MRRETDFVLENADWPVLLLEENGDIRRANRVARQIFGDAVQKKFTTLAALWAEENSSTAEKFLAGQGKNATCDLNLRLNDGAKGKFAAHISPVMRDGQNYFVIQLFKEPSVPPPAPKAATPEKSENIFGLEDAEWPALLVKKNGNIVRANRSAVQIFGSNIEKEGALLITFWSQENKESAVQFLHLPTHHEGVAIRFHLKSGVTAGFMTQCCPAGKEDCLVQLFKEISVAPTTTSAPVAAPMPTTGASGTPAEIALAHKQKLDRALQLARSVSLDFNNALTSILGHTSLILSKVDANNPWRNSLVEIEKSVAKATEIANDLAAFSRQEKDSRVQMAGNLNVILERTVDLFRTEHKSITWSLQFERKLFTVNVDESKMQQAFVKILENAIQVVKTDGRISVQTRNLELSEATQDRTAKLNPGTYVCVDISDNGEGIAPDVLPRIFEPFFTTKGAKHRGLGLAWVYGIVTNHGGGVAVSTQPGIGTSVRVYLPANKKIVKDTSVSIDNLNGNKTVLMVDDEDLLLTMGQMVLSSFGYTVLTANSGHKALEFFSNTEQPIDLVITDVVMPNMSGRELTEHIQRISPNTKIIWSSGYVRATTQLEHETYLQKPFTSQDLLRKVKQALTVE